MAVICLDHVSKRFILRMEGPRSFQDAFIKLLRGERRSRRQEFWALQDVSLEVQAGETVGLIGPNGAGKSTILKLISRILVPTEGHITVSGRVSTLLELGAGFHPDLTGRENIYLNGSVLGLSRREVNVRLDDIVAFAELERFIDMPVKHYSSGMYTRLGFAIAAHVEPDVLLVDEVLAVGDQNFQHKCLERILDLQSQGVTICFVSHDLGAVRRLCTHAIWLEDGMVQAAGDVDDTVAAYLRHAAAREEAVITARVSQPDSPVGSPAAVERRAAEAERRWGTRDIEIVSVSFLDAAAGERHVFRVGEPWMVRLRYRARQRIEKPVFGLAVHRNDGLHVCGPNTHVAGLDIPSVEREGEVLYRVDRLPLMEGTYLVSVSAHNQADTVMYDYHDRLYTFRVRQVEKGEQYGLVRLEGTWEWKQAGMP